MERTLNQILRSLKESLEKFSVQQENFLLVFLFGSFARGFGTDESDVDVAIMFKKAPDFYELCDLKDQLSRCAGKEVDILTLNTGYCQLFCVNFLTSNSLRKGRFLRTFPIGFDLQCNSIFRQIKARRV